MTKRRKKTNKSSQNSPGGSSGGSAPQRKYTKQNGNAKKSSNQERRSSTASMSGSSVYSNASKITQKSHASNYAGPSSNSVRTNNDGINLKVPPIMVKSISPTQLMKDLSAHKVPAQYKLCRVGTKVVCSNKIHYDNALSYLKEQNAEFYTHDIPGEKPFKVVVRGLPDIEPNIIKRELAEHFKLVPLAVYPMTRKNEKTSQYRDRLFLIHFQRKTTTLQALQAIRAMFSIIVKWEPYRGGNRDVTQCQRCLNFGHGTKNCYMLPRCASCGQSHLTNECPPCEDPTVVKCANCGGDHQGTDRKCPKRELFKQIRQQATTINQQKRTRKTPMLRNEDFPALSSQQAPITQVTGPASAWSVQNRLVQTPPIGPQQPPRQPSSELFSSSELMQIFTSMTTALRQCRSKADQIQVLGGFIIQYGS